MPVASALDQSWDDEDGTSFAAPLVSGAAAWVWTARPELDASQLFEVMRRSATDIDAPGRDDASGYGLLNVPAALAYAAPAKDPMEPNDDMDYVRSSGVYATGSLPLTTRATPNASVTARLTVFEDPRDVYPVFIPAKKTITVKTSAATVDLALWSTGTPSVTIPGPGKNRLARGVTKTGTETVTYANPGNAKVVYLAVTLAKGTRDASYSLSVAAR
jgi:subtilase family protein